MFKTRIPFKPNLIMILEKLASSLGRRDEIPNQELAKEIIITLDKKSVKELVENLTNKNKDIQSDCIKILYEIGTIHPALISEYTENFVKLLQSKNNRMHWGAMMAINSITTENPNIVFSILSKLAIVVESGSVITRDNYVSILTKLCAVNEYMNDAFLLLNEQLVSCPSNQLPMYAENALSIITEHNKDIFTKTLLSRLNNFEKESKRRRIEKVLKRLKNISNLH